MNTVLSKVRFHVLAVGAVVGLLACNKSAVRKVYFGNLNDGATVESPFQVEMKAENLVVEPASKGVIDGHGHFHIIIDNPASDAPNPIPKDATHIHYGKGDTVATLDLPVGSHSLILQFAKGDHVPYDPQIEQEIHITVSKRNVPPAPADTNKHADSAKAK